jgi:hypothetical protein
MKKRKPPNKKEAGIRTKQSSKDLIIANDSVVKFFLRLLKFTSTHLHARLRELKRSSSKRANAEVAKLGQTKR